MSGPLPILQKSPEKSGLAIDPRAYERGLSCVHCGLCLPACPTYVESGLEADSPRGRIQLMLGLADGKIEASDSVRHHLDLCLDCRGCETACPSGVIYHELLEETRGRLAQSQRITTSGRFMRWLFFKVFTHPTRLKIALFPARILQKLGIYALLRKSGIFGLLPSQLAKMEQMLPTSGRLWPARLNDLRSRAPNIAGAAPGTVTPAQQEMVRGADPTRIGQDDSAAENGKSTRGAEGTEAIPLAATPARPARTIGFFAGCIGSVLFEKVNRQAVEVLAACGADVVVPRRQGCCGAIHLHSGAHAPAEAMARRNIDTFLPVTGKGVDFITSTIAGCGAMLREYDVLLRDDPQYAGRAMEFVARVRDISEVLLELGLPEMPHAVEQVATYHDACHLAHAQKVTSAPRQLLGKIRGLKLMPLPENDLCCGAAGTYNLTQPEMSTALAVRKVENIAKTGASLCATGNVGCAMQIQSVADQRGIKCQVVHPVELLHRAIFGE